MAVADQSAPTEIALGPFLRRVRIRNYKSIGHCQVPLRPLTVLVGRNGAGKSNFLDALGFVGDALRSSLDQAMAIELLRMDQLEPDEEDLARQEQLDLFALDGTAA